ncbi:MAG: hypothetical protein GY839_11880 [candidate division Zixibacteria bacterium]|nr:hypothetical protein [candidate division Zixibacteria bacterium]
MSSFIKMLAVIAVLFASMIATAVAEIPRQISFQGILKDSSGEIVEDSVYLVTFTIYDDTTADNIWWQEGQDVETEDGYFTVLLGSVNPVEDSVFDGSSRYLGIQIDGESEMQQRLPITSTAHAYRSADSGGGADDDWISDGDNVYRIDGNVGVGTLAPQARFQVRALAGQKAMLIKGDDPDPMLDADVESDFMVNPHSGTGKSFRIRSYTEDGVLRNNLVVTNEFTHPSVPDLVLQPDDGNVGVGTSNPQHKLHVQGVVRSRSHESDPYYADFASRYNYNESFYLNVRGGDPVDTKILGFGNTDTLLSSYSAPNALIVKGITGNVGVGTTNPSTKLDVSGAVTASTYYGDGSNLTGISGSGDDDWTINGNEIYHLNGNVGIGTTSPSERLDVNGDIRTQSGDLKSPTRFALLTDGGAAQILKAGALAVTGSYANDPPSSGLYVQGKAGIGTTSPDAKLTVLTPSGAAGAFRTTSSGSVSLWAFNESGVGLSCGTGGSSSAAFHPIAYNNDARKLAIECDGSIEATGTIEANSSWSGVNAITGTNSGNYSGVAGINTSNGNGIYGSSVSGYAGYFSGNVRVTGYLYKDGGGFQIDHPLDPENKYLNHSFVESPDMKNIYDGVAILDKNGEASVELPEYFDALNKDFRYQLTCIGGFANVYIAQEIENNRFGIAGGVSGMKISWQVTGIRNDAIAQADRIPIEIVKSDEEKGKYIHPEVYGKPMDTRIGQLNQK